MASSNRLVVEVVGDTSKLTSSLNSAQQQINRFAGRSKIKSTGADALLAQVRGLETQADALAKRSDQVSTSQLLLQSRLGGTALKAGVAGAAVYALGQNLQSLGGNVGKLGNAFSALSTGNIVGFVQGLQSINAADPAKIGSDLVKMGDAAKASATANQLAAAGFDNLAAAARAAAAQITAVNNAFVDNTKIHDPTSPGAIAGDPTRGGVPTAAARRAGVSQSQRNLFFDNKITRELDRVQDLVLSAQVQRLQDIRKEVEARLAKTKDRTRELTLGDEIVQIDRSIKSVNDEIKNGLKKTATTLKPVGKKIAENFKQQADDIKSAVLAAFDTKTDKIHNAQDLKDAQKVLRQSRQLGGAGSIELALRDVNDAKRAIARQRILDTPFSISEGPRGPVNTLAVGSVTFNIATSDPDKVVAIVLKRLQTSNRHGSPQGRGRAPGAWTGLH